MHAISRSFPILIRALRQPCPQLRSYATRLRRKSTPRSPIMIAAPVKVTLRDYQEECIQTVIQHIDMGVRRMGVSLATGSGKTVIFTQLIDRVSHPTTPEATQSLILVHRRELVEQAAKHCAQHYPDKIVEVEMASSHATGLADITVASIASITSGERIEKFDPRRFKLVLIDECHHAVAAGYLRCLEHFRLLPVEEDSPVLVGVTATMSRFDGLGLEKVLDKIVYHKSYVDMIGEKWLSPCKFTTVKTSIDLSEVRDTSAGDYHLGDLGKAVNTNEANEVAVRAWLEKAVDRKSTIVFCVDIAHVNDMTAKFRRYDIDARCITSKTILQERKARLDEFKNGKYQVLVNCGVFTEGTDIPNIDCVLLARPTRSKNLMVQMIGRGMRLYPGKKDCHVIDMVGSVDQGIITAPTLFGLDPDELLEEVTVEDLQKRANSKEVFREGEEAIEAEQQPVPKASLAPIEVTFVDYASVWDLLADKQENHYIRQISAFSWVIVDKNKYILSTQGGFIKIEGDEDGTFSVTEVRKLPPVLEGGRPVYTKPRKIINGVSTLDEAAHGADTYASHHAPRTLLMHNARWRQAPASDEQLAVLGRFPEIKLDSLTKGQAGDMITKLKHGVLRTFEKRMREKTKKEKQKAKAEALRNREIVRVGDLKRWSGPPGIGVVL